MKKELEGVVESVHSEPRGQHLNLALLLSSCMAFGNLVNYLAVYPNQKSEDNNRIYFTRLSQGVTSIVLRATSGTWCFLRPRIILLIVPLSLLLCAFWI